MFGVETSSSSCGGDVCFRPSVMENAFNSVQEQLNYILNNFPVVQRCEKIQQLLQTITFKEASLLPALLNNIFGLIGSVDWNLRYSCILFIVHANDSQDSIKVPSRKIFMEGGVPPFYLNKISNQNLGSRGPPCVSLNAFEYFFFHFAFYAISPMHPSWPSTDTLYNSLFEEYLNTFVLVSGYFSEMLCGIAHSTTQLPAFSLQSATSMLKPQPMVHLSFNDCQPLYGDDCPAHIVVSIFSEFWLSVQPRTHMHSFIPADVCEVPALAFQHQVYLIRVLIKYIHHFVGLSYLEETSKISVYKRFIWNLIQKPLYTFLQFNIDFWPMDGSFRLLIETWLSAIQPWRYLSLKKKPPSSEWRSDVVTPLELKWSSFISSNIALYSGIFQDVINRMLTMDFTSAKNALVVFRISKILSIPSLSYVIEETEKLHCNKSTFYHNSSQFLTGTSTVPMFGSETRSKVAKLIQILLRAYQSLQQQIIQGKAQPSRQTFFEWLWNALSGDDSTQEDQDEADILIFINLAITNFCHVFQLICPDLSILQIPSNVEHLSWESQTDSSLRLEERRRVLRKGHPNFTGYTGNPDLHPIRSKEVAWLVRAFYHLSSFLNEKAGATLQRMYFESGYRGALFRELLEPPVVYHEFVKEVGGKTVRSNQHLPPRISLRCCAELPTLLCILMVYAICFFLDVKFLTFFLLFSSSFFLWTCVKAIWHWSNPPALASETSS